MVSDSTPVQTTALRAAIAVMAQTSSARVREGRGADGGGAARARGSCATAPRFNNCVEGQDAASRSKYQAVAESTITTLVTNYLTPTSSQDKRIPGILTESCFNKRPDARPHDAANKCEFIVADYYLLECLLVLAGDVDPVVL